MEEERRFSILKAIFYAPFILVLTILIAIAGFLSRRLEYGAPYWIENAVAMQYLVRFTRWFIGKEEFDNLVKEQGRKHMAKLFGVKAGEVMDYVPKACREEAIEDQPIFKLKFLEVAEYADIQDELFKSTGFGKKRQEKFMLGQQTMLALRVGLTGWSNFKHQDGSDVEWEDPGQGRDKEDRARIMDRNLNKIPPAERAEMADYIRGESSLGEDD
jgi:hypothetical protein